MSGLDGVPLALPYAHIRWGVYARISEDVAGEGLGVERQVGDCKELAARIGGTIIDTYVDNDTSAYSGKPRKGYERLLYDLVSGRINGVLAWHNDRLHRRPTELEAYIDICQPRDAPTVTVKAGPLDLTTPSGRMVARTLGAFARFESEHKSERLRAKHLELALDGKTSGAPRSYGYERIYDREEKPRRILREVIEPDEAAIIRDWARRKLAGESLSSLRRDTNAAGIKTVNGKNWNNSSIARVLMSAKISGRREHRPAGPDGKRPAIGKITSKATWPAIISEQDSDRLRQMLTAPERRLSPGPTGKYLGAGGLLVCGDCGRFMVGRSRGKDRPRGYICNGQDDRGCGRVRVVAEPAEREVAAMVATVLANPELREAIERGSGKPDDSHLIAEIAACEVELKQLAADHGNRLIGREEWLAARQPIVHRRDAAKARLSTAGTMRVLEGVPLGREELAAFLLDDSVEVTRRRAVCFTVLERVRVFRPRAGENFFDPDRLDPDWKS